MTAARAEVGIVVPCFNAARFITSTLESILAQSFVDWRCVVVDNKSTDNSRTLVESFLKRDERFEAAQEPVAGASRVRNRGFEHLKGRCAHVIFLDADDQWLPGALQALVELAREHFLAPAVMGAAEFIDENDAPIDRRDIDPHALLKLLYDGHRVQRADVWEPIGTEHLATWPTILTPGIVLLRHDAFAKSGGFDVELLLAEDYELWYRIAQQGRIVCSPTTVLRHRKHAGSLSRSKTRRRQMALARQKILKNPNNTPEQSHYARAARRAIYRYLARERSTQAFDFLRKCQPKEATRQFITALANLSMAVR